MLSPTPACVCRGLLIKTYPSNQRERRRERSVGGGGGRKKEKEGGEKGGRKIIYRIRNEYSCGICSLFRRDLIFNTYKSFSCRKAKSTSIGFIFENQFIPYLLKDIVNSIIFFVHVSLTVKETVFPPVIFEKQDMIFIFIYIPWEKKLFFITAIFFLIPSFYLFFFL